MAMALRLPARPSESLIYIELAIFLLLFVVAGLCGGSARQDVPGLVILQPLAVLCIAGALLVPTPFHFDRIGAPLLFLAAIALLMVIQLIPLPPSLWASLPGRADLLSSSAVAGLPQPWRPISLSPDLTLDSLVGLIVPAAALLCLATLDTRRTALLLPLLIAVALISAALGLLQLAGGPSSAFYWYSITNRGEAVGIFANRNHNGLLLAMAFPMLAVLTSLPEPDPMRRRIRFGVCAAAALFLAIAVLVGGARSGIVLMLFSLVAALWLMPFPRPVPEASLAMRLLVSKWTVVVLGSLLLPLLTIVLARTEGIRRLFADDFFQDRRLDYIPTVKHIIVEYFPLGTGLGSFDPVFRLHEPTDALRNNYVNHAHNELLEVTLTAGLPGLLILAVFFGWVVLQARKALRRRDESLAGRLARLALVMLALIFGASLIDYPLRTPMMGIVFVIACVWLCLGDDDRTAQLALRPRG